MENNFSKVGKMNYNYSFKPYHKSRTIQVFADQGDHEPDKSHHPRYDYRDIKTYEFHFKTIKSKFPTSYSYNETHINGLLPSGDPNEYTTRFYTTIEDKDKVKKTYLALIADLKKPLITSNHYLYFMDAVLSHRGAVLESPEKHEILLHN